VRLEDVDDDLPILMFYYAEVLAVLEAQVTTRSRKVPRTEALEMFLKTRSFKATADHFGVTPATINGIVYTAFRSDCVVMLCPSRVRAAPAHEGWQPRRYR
jgi:hypothetical protein